MEDIAEFDGVSDYVQRRVRVIHQACFILWGFFCRPSRFLSPPARPRLFPFFLFFYFRLRPFLSTRPCTEGLNPSV